MEGIMDMMKNVIFCFQSTHYWMDKIAKDTLSIWNLKIWCTVSWILILIAPFFFLVALGTPIIAVRPCHQKKEGGCEDHYSWNCAPYLLVSNAQCVFISHRVSLYSIVSKKDNPNLRGGGEHLFSVYNTPDESLSHSFKIQQIHISDIAIWLCLSW